MIDTGLRRGPYLFRLHSLLCPRGIIVLDKGDEPRSFLTTLPNPVMSRVLVPLSPCGNAAGIERILT